MEAYAGRLREVWAEHQALATRFKKGSAVSAGEAQIEALRTLGYVD